MKIYQLGRTGLAHLERLLDQGDELAQSLKSQDLSRGHVLTFLPDAVELNRISLEAGGLSHFSWDDEFCQSVSSLIERHLKLQDTAFVMELKSISRQLAKQLYEKEPYSVFFSKTSRHVVLDAERRPRPGQEIVGVYGCIYKVEEGVNNIGELLADRRPFGAVGSLTSFVNQSVPLSMSDCDSSIFVEFANNAQYILGSAFDDEGWIIWARTIPEWIQVEGQWR